MSLLHLAYIIALRRIISGWRLELVLFLGMVLAVALMSSGVIFSDLVAESALSRALDQATEEQARFSVQSHHGLDDPSRVSKPVSAYQSSLDFVDSRVAVPFQPYLRDQASLFETATFFFEGHPQLELDDNERPRGRFKYMSDLFPASRRGGTGAMALLHGGRQSAGSGRATRGRHRYAGDRATPAWYRPRDDSLPRGRGDCRDTHECQDRGGVPAGCTR